MHGNIYIHYKQNIQENSLNSYTNSNKTRETIQYKIHIIDTSPDSKKKHTKAGSEQKRLSHGKNRNQQKCTNMRESQSQNNNYKMSENSLQPDGLIM